MQTLQQQKTEKKFYYCEQCDSWHLDERDLPSQDEEFHRYNQHQNSPKDQRYRNFLSQLAAPVLEHVTETDRGLDYGCGPSPVLSQLFKERGIQLDYFDPFFYPQPPAKQIYDFITCSEAAEHFHRPASEFERLSSMVKPGGLLAIMTAKLEMETNFASWYYAKDPTHVFFYSDKTFDYIGERFGFKVQVVSTRVTLLTKI